MNEPSSLLQGLSEEAVGRLEEACCRFEEAWQAGRRPRLEDFVCGPEGDERLALLRELLRLEVHYRRQAGERPSAADYQTRFPQATVVLQEIIASVPGADRPHAPLAGDPERTGQELLPPTTDEGHAAGNGDVQADGDPGDARPSRYRVLRFHAAGNMGEVFLAEDTELHRNVALKEIKPERAQRQEYRSRFVLEAEVTGRLEHPGVVPVYGLGAYADGRPFYAMRFIQGDKLAVAIAQFHARPPLQFDSLEFRGLLGRFVAVCQAVAYAHSRGVLHRDLKPGNIMLGKFGETLVVDWGLAKVAGQPGGDGAVADEEERLRLRGDGGAATATGAVVGTPAFMSPEQARGEGDGLGPAADVYGLGATLYALLTNQAPFRGKVTEVLPQVQRGEWLPARQVNAAVPAALDAICRKAMALRPDERYGSALELAGEVEHWLADEPVAAYREPVGSRLRRWMRKNSRRVMAAGQLLLVAVVGILILSQVRTTAALAEATRQRGRAERYEYLSRIYQAGQAYQDNRMARAREALRDCKLEQPGWEWHYLNRITDAEQFQASGHLGAVLHLTLPRHGRWMVSGGADHNVIFWDASTGHQLHQVRGHTGPVWGTALSANGQRLATVAGSAETPGELIVWTITEEPRLEVREAFRHSDTGERAAVAFHPSEPLLALAAGIGSKDAGSVLLVDAEGKTVAAWTTERDQTAVALSWSPDGERLAVAYRGSSKPSGEVKPSVEVWIRQFPMGQPIHRLSLPDGSVLHDGDIQVVRYSDDGRFLATAGGDGLIHLWDARTHALLRTFRGHTAGVTTLTFAPQDGAPQDHLISAGLDTTVRAWELSTGRPLFVRRGHEMAVRCVAVTPGPKGMILSGGDDAWIYAWRSEQLQESEGYDLHEGAVTSIAFSPQSGHLISVGEDGVVWQTDPTQKSPPRRLRDEKRPLRCLRFVPGSDRCLLAGGAKEPGGIGVVRLLDAKAGKVLEELPTGLLLSSHLSVTRDGEWVSVVGLRGDQNTVVQVWNLPARRKDHEFNVPGATAAVLYQGGKSLFVLVDTMQAHAGMPDPVEVREADRVEYDLSAGGRPVRSPSRGFPGMRFATLSADETYLLIGGRVQALTIDRPARIGGTTYRSLWGHSAAINNAVFNPEETLFATASEDESIRVWDFESGLELLALRGDPCSMNDVAFSPTGEFLAGAQANGMVRIWDGRPSGERR